MPYKDPERYREYQREKQREYARRDPEKYRERWRRNREANGEKIREQKRAAWPAYYARHRQELLDYQRDYNIRNADKVRERNKQRRDPDSERARNMLRKHGLRPEGWAALYEAQHGRCYLCGEEMSPEEAAIDHDHACCPRNESCAICRRGIAHDLCNSTIGMGGDDPARLRRMADALEAAQKEVEHRKAAAGAGEQLLLIE